MTCVSVNTIFTGECIVFLLLKYGITVCAVSYGFWSYCLIVYNHLICINTQRRITTPFSSFLPSSPVSVICCATKIRFKACVISFHFYSNNNKVYIHLPCITTQRPKTSQFDITHALWYSDHQTTRLYQGSADCCERDFNSDVISLF